MTARCAALLALYWLGVLFTAAVADLAAGIPFTGPAASAVGVLASTGVCFVGFVGAPHPGGTR